MIRILKPFKLTFLFLSLIFLISCKSDPIDKPRVFTFGAPVDIMNEAMAPLCDSIIKRNIDPRELPTATYSQVQLDCYGFEFDGRKRKVELVFGDNELDLVWLFTEASENKKYIENFKSLYGQPSHEIEDAAFFIKAGVAVRNEPHEILFISERLKFPYEQWLDSKKNSD